MRHLNVLLTRRQWQRQTRPKIPHIPYITWGDEWLNQDPYGKGWLFTLKPSAWVAETAGCYLAAEATDWLTNELQHYKDFLALNMHKYSPQESMAVLQDGGELSENSLSGFPDECWQDFQKEFLNP